MHMFYWEVGCHASVTTEMTPAPAHGLLADLSAPEAAFFFLKFVQAKFSLFFYVES